MKAFDVDVIAGRTTTDIEVKRHNSLLTLLATLMSRSPTHNHMAFELTSSHPLPTISVPYTKEHVNQETLMWSQDGHTIRTLFLVVHPKLPYAVAVLANSIIVLMEYDSEEELNPTFAALFPVFFAADYEVVYKNENGDIEPIPSYCVEDEYDEPKGN